MMPTKIVWNEKKNKGSDHRTMLPELLTVVIYIALLVFVTAFHEPWFDEAQSWQIAKCESIGRILFHIPHYEGNPPLWYLLLAIPAKLGVPFEWGLKSVGLLICLCSVLLLELKSPFPRPIKLLLPFTYFFFYQYGVIVRPYCLVLLAFMLTAISFPERNRKPWRFVLCLIFLSLTSSFCVAIAGGIAACWLFEIIKEKGFSPLKLFGDRRIIALCVLLVFALALAITVFPPSDALFLKDFLSDGQNSALVCFLVALFTVLAETLLTTSPWFSIDRANLAFAHLSAGGVVLCVVVQVIVFVMIICFSSRKNLKYFFIPYIFYCFFGAVVLLGGHYLGIAWGILLFWLWINFADENRFEIGKKIVAAFHFSSRDNRLFLLFCKVFCFLSIAVSFFWTLSSACREIELPYAFGRGTAAFLEESGLVNAKIAAKWNRRITAQEDEIDDKTKEDYEKMDLQSMEVGAILSAYAGRNIVYNFNDGADERAYVQYIEKTAKENKETMERWKRVGVPDVLLGEVDVEFLTDDKYSMQDYTPVFEMKSHYIWKGLSNISIQYVYVRNDLLETYKVVPLDRPEGIIGKTGFVITDEMRERYQNGEDVNDILKPYLDYLFGEESGKKGSFLIEKNLKSE